MALNGAHLMHDAYNLILARIISHSRWARVVSFSAWSQAGSVGDGSQSPVASKFTITTALTRAFADESTY